MDKYKLGDLVQITDTSMKNLPGVVVYLDKKNEKYLIRVGTQQLYFSENQLIPWPH